MNVYIWDKFNGIYKYFRTERVIFIVYICLTFFLLISGDEVEISRKQKNESKTNKHSLTKRREKKKTRLERERIKREKAWDHLLMELASLTYWVNSLSVDLI